MCKLGSIVTFHPHEEHPRLIAFGTLAAIVGQVHADGTLSLMVLPPNAEPVWMDAVPQSTSPDHHYSWTAGPDAAAIAQTALDAASAAQTAAQAAHSLATHVQTQMDQPRAVTVSMAPAPDVPAATPGTPTPSAPAAAPVAPASAT